MTNNKLHEYGEEVNSLKKYLMDILSNPDDETLMRTLSILRPQEIYILSLMATMADFMKKYDPYNASILEGVIRNHLLLKISVDGTGRRDLKDIVNPRPIYLSPFKLQVKRQASIKILKELVNLILKVLNMLFNILFSPFVSLCELVFRIIKSLLSKKEK